MRAPVASPGCFDGQEIAGVLRHEDAAVQLRHCEEVRVRKSLDHRDSLHGEHVDAVCARRLCG